MDKKSTTVLLNTLKQAETIEDLEAYLQSLSEPLPPFYKFFFFLDEIKPYESTYLIHASGIERSYFYQIQSGKRKPGRDKVIRLCIAGKLSIKNIQRSLISANLRLLYPRDRRDSIILYAINHDMSVWDTCHLLESMHSYPLE